MKKRSFLSSTAFSAICGGALFAVAALVLSHRAEGRRVTHAASSNPVAGKADASLLPSGEAMADWAPREAPVVYVRKNLFELINGGADQYLDYGFQKLLHAEYARKDDPRRFLTIDLYDMGTPEGAFGIYGYERGDRPSNEAVGEEGIVLTTSLAFRRGRYYVKIETNDLSGATARAARPIALRTASLIPGPPGRIEAIEAFPADHLVAGSHRLILQNPLGLQSLPRAYLADYALQGRKATLFLAPLESADRARLAVEGLRKELEDRWTVESRPGGLSARAREGRERIVARQAGAHVAGIRGELDDSEATKILDSLQANIGR